MFYNKNEISNSSFEKKKDNEELSIFNLSQKKLSTIQNETKISENLQKRTLNDQKRVSEDISLVNRTFTLSNTVNINSNIGYDKFNKAQRILENQKERMNSLSLKNNLNINLLQNNIPISKPLIDINKGLTINNNCLIKTNLKENNNIINNNSESVKKEMINSNQAIETQIKPNIKSTEEQTIPNKIINKRGQSIDDDDEMFIENNVKIIEENKIERENSNNSIVVNENDPKYSLYYHVIASPIKPIGFDELRNFLTLAVPEGKTLQCNILRKKTGMERLYPKYYVSINNNEKFLMAARKRPKNTTPNYLITMDNELFEKNSSLCLGKLRSNFLGTEFQIYDSGKNPDDTKNFDDVRAHLGCIKYKTNFFGMNGPRQMKVYLPNLDKFGNTIIYKPLNKNESIVNKFKNGDNQNIRVYVNKQPKWSEKHQAFVLNFNGRVERGSVKNFQLVDEEDDEKVILQFGRLSDNLFSMDFASPLSPFQAFAICLSSLDNKFACE